MIRWRLPPALWKGVQPETSNEWIEYKASGPRTFDRFIELHKRSDAEIGSYARKWGVLGLCSHNLPSTHNQWKYGVGTGSMCLPQTSRSQSSPGELWCKEPIDEWRKYSARASLLLQLGAKINNEAVGSKREWAALRDEEVDIFDDPNAPAFADMNSARVALSHQLEKWFVLGGLLPSISWNPKLDLWQFTLSGVGLGPNLLALLALHLALTIARKIGRSLLCLPKSV